MMQLLKWFLVSALSLAAAGARRLDLDSPAASARSPAWIWMAPAISLGPCRRVCCERHGGWAANRFPSLA